MSAKQKKGSQSKPGTQKLIAVDPALSAFENHPFFENQAASAKALLKKTGLPKELSKKG